MGCTDGLGHFVAGLMTGLVVALYLMLFTIPRARGRKVDYEKEQPPLQ